MILLTGFKMEDTTTFLYLAVSGNNKMIWKRNDLKVLKHIADSELSVILMLIPSNYEKSDTIDISTCMLIEVCL